MTEDKEKYFSPEWCMVDDQGQRYMLPKTMIFMGHEECDFIIEGSSVDKRHAVVTFDHYLNKFKIKDLSTIHGTFINDARIPEQEYITLEEKYTIRLGYSQSIYYIEQVFDTPYNVEEESNSPDKIATWPSNSHKTMEEVDETVNQEVPNHEEFEEQQQRSNENLQQNYESSYNGYISNDPNHTWPRKRRPKSWTSQSNYSSQFAEEKKRSSYHVESTVDAEQDYLNSIPPSIMKSSHSTLGNLQSQNNNVSYTKSDFVSMEGVPSAPEKTQPPVSHNNQTVSSVKSPLQSYSEPSGANENNTYRTRNDITRIKKVTPLYGQPSWWGEPDIVENESVDSSNTSQNQKKKCNDSETSDKTTKPGNLVVYNLQSDTSHNLEKYKNDPKYACTYMEISHRDFELENNTTCRGSLSSSISKDSLVSHDSRKGSLEISSDHGKKQSSSERELSVEKTEPVNKVADAGGTAFTVEIGEQKPRKWNSLSEFMPSKIRRSFRERSERAMKQSTKDGTAPKFVEADSPPDQSKEGEILGEKGKTKIPKPSQSSEGEEENHTKVKKDANLKNNKISPSSFQPYKPVSHQNDNEEISPPTCSGAASFLINKMFQGSNCPSNVNPASTSPSDYCLIPGSEAPASSGKFFDPSTGQDHFYDQKNLNGNNEPVDKTCTDSSPEAQDLEAIEDKLSEAGTYTIEGDQEAKEEEEMARKRIDNVFGVGQNIQRPIIVEFNRLEQDSSILGKESSEINHVGKFLEESRFYLNNGSNNNCSPETGVDQLEDRENLKDISPESNTCDIIPQNSEKTLADSEFKPQSESSGSSPLVSKPPLGCPRKRAGTGRKLPSLPPESGVSPSSKPQKQPTTQRKEEKWTSSDVSKKQKSYLTSNQSSGGIKTTRTKVDTDHDTDRLLKDTETAVAALEARVTNHSISQGTDGSESDVSSNTNYNFNKNSALRSSNRSLSDQPSSRKSSFSDNAKPKASSKNIINSKERNPPIQRNYSKGSEKGSVSSDITSESEALETMSNNSDFSLECGSEGDGYHRRGSKGKGGISMTRPNRAFQLRQAKARGAEVVDKPPPHSGSGKGTSLNNTVSKTSVVKGKVKRVNSVNLPAERLSETQRSTGLSTESIHKSYENIKGNSNFIRTDGGRYSLRVRRSASTSTPRNSSESRTRSDLKSTKSQLKAAYSTPGLNIASLSSKSNSQPTSRSNSPRSVDKSNLKRRKEFNQRQQKSSTVSLNSGPSADMKNTKTQMSASKAECSEVSMNSRMIRSASLELSKYKNSVDAVSSQKSSSRSYRDVSNIGEERIKSGFVPYSGLGTFQSCLCHPDAFDYGNEERLLLPKSMQDINKSSLTTYSYQSAFAPASMRKPYTSNLQSSFSTLQSSCRNSSLLKKDDVLVKKRELFNIRQSYDNIIISSIYQLSLKLKTATDRTIQKLRESNKVSQTPSPVDDYLTDPSSSEMPAWKSANQELAAILCILRKIEHRIHVIDRVLFPDKDNGIDSDGLTQREKQLYLQEIERIRTEIAGFQPIDNPEDKMWKKKQRQPQGNSSTCHAIGLTEEELF